MPTTYVLYPSQRLVRSRAFGVLTEAESWTHYTGLSEDAAFDPTFRQICDLTDVTKLEASSDFLRDLARKSVFAPGTRRAFVAPTALHFGLARMLQVFCDLEGSEVGVFLTEEEAESWLGLDDAADGPHSGASHDPSDEAPA
ncbi:MAG: hypothetical protein RJQ04_20675 [Longimicrobiales bacterium]